MKKKVAVLLLRVAGAPDQPTKTYVEQLYTAAGKGTNNLVDYYEDMSHGKLDISDCTVYDWIDYGHTAQDLMDEWNKAFKQKEDELLKAGVDKAKAAEAAGVHANATRRGKITEWGNEAATKNNLLITGFDVIVYIFNQSIDFFGSTGYTVISWNPDGNNHAGNSISLAGTSHEFGHALGLMGHARMEGSEEEYGDLWDIMGDYHYSSDKRGTAIPPPDDSKYYTYGPGLNAAYMDLMGWLDKSRVYTAVGSTSFQLRPLHRRDLPGWLCAKMNVGYETIYVEFRMNEKWDNNFAAPCVFLHKKAVHPGDGTPSTEIMMTDPAHTDKTEQVDLRNGQSYSWGDISDPFGFYASITVTKIDVEQRIAYINLYVRYKRRVEQRGMLFGAIEEGGGGYVWTPGRGLKKVPPRSPLINIIELIGEMESLHELESNGQNMNEMTIAQLMKIRDGVTGIIESRRQVKVPKEYSIDSHRKHSAD
jgi:M6 family metalloprotease-like protein